MTAALVPFPIVRRRELIERIAEQMFARSRALAERHLATQIRRQVSAMRRRQLGDDAIASEMRSFESAVRTEYWRLVMTPQQPTGAA